MDLNAKELFEVLRTAQARQALIQDLLKDQRKTSDPEAMMRAASESIGRHLRVDRVGFFEIREGVLDFSAGWTAGRLELLSGGFPATGIGTRYLAEVQAGRTLAISDARIDQLTADSLFAEIGGVSSISAPIIRNDRWHGGFYVNHSEARDWTDDEIALVRNVGEQTWDAIERARAEIALRRSEERLTLALEASGGVGTWDWDIKAHRVYSDARVAYLFSVDPARAASGASPSEYIKGIHPSDRAQISDSMRLAFEREKEFSLEYRVLPRDGSVRWLQARGRYLRDEAGNPIRSRGVVIDVTERKQTEVHLRQQWHTFDTVLSHTPDFIYIFDVQGRFTYANCALLSLLQKSLEEVAGRKFSELEYPPELAARLERQIRQVVDTSQSLRDQTPFTGPSGETGIYEYIFVPVLDANGQVEAVAGSTRDITERNRAEKIVEEDRGRWRDLLLQAPAAIALLSGPEHRFEWTNGGYDRLVGRPAEFLIGKTVAEALPEVEGQIYLNLLDTVYRTGRPFYGHESFLQLNGGNGTPENLYLNFVYLATRNSAGEIEGIFVHVTDVTDLVVARQRVEESERWFRQLADSMPQMVWTADRNGRVDYHNERWYKFTGFDRPPTEERSWISIVHPDDAPRAREAWNRSVQSGEPYQCEFRFWDRHEKRWRWIMGRAVSVRNDSGQVMKWFGTGTDIDEQKASQQAVLQTQKLESIGLLAGGIAHDFNNLLVGILGGASLALDTVAASHPVAGLLQTIVNAGERAAHLTRQMLAYAGKGKFIIEPVDLSALSLQTLALVRAMLPKNVQVKLQLEEQLPAVETDAGQMQQVAMNLIINAAEAMGEKNGAIMVRTHAEKITPGGLRRSVDGSWISPGRYVVLEVQDTGCGIEASTLNSIFDPFFTTKFTGRGLGLAAVSGIVRSHQGGIEVETELGKGSTFRVLLPASSERIVIVPPAPLRSIGKGLGTVLVIDDEEVVRQVAKAALSLSGYDAIVASNGEQGLEYIRLNQEISLVLLDMSMPGLSGRQILEALRIIRPLLQVLICSGYSEDEVSRHFHGMTMAGILEKPFTAKQLAAKVISIMTAAA